MLRNRIVEINIQDKLFRIDDVWFSKIIVIRDDAETYEYISDKLVYDFNLKSLFGDIGRQMCKTVYIHKTY